MATKKKAIEPLRLIQYQRELITKPEIDMLPRKLRGIYVLYKVIDSGEKTPYRNVVYVGMSASGIKGRLRQHREKKGAYWDVCSVFVVWPNVRMEEIRELEGILRHIFRWDSEAQMLNAQGTYLRLSRHTPCVELDEANRGYKEYIDDDEELADDEVVIVKKRAKK